MDISPSLEQYEAMYKAALAANEHAPFTPKSLKKVEELQQNCRVCGCQDDGTFVDLDATQDFEFESSITSYRILFQRTSLQFQFHTMPDLPSRICMICGYKAKIFFLQTRQFVINQLGMRSTVSDWYQKTHGVEAPEQNEDKMQLMKQLVMIKAAKCKKQQQQRETPRRLQMQPIVRDLYKQGPKMCNHELKRSVSADDRLNAASGKNKGPNAPGKYLKGAHQMARSTANLGFPAKSSNPLLVKTSKGYQNQFQNATKPQQSRTARSEIPKFTAIREKTMTLKSAENRECSVPPRVVKTDRLLYKPHSNRKAIDTAENSSNNNNNNNKITEVPPSKAQLQQKLQERRRQWR